MQDELDRVCGDALPLLSHRQRYKEEGTAALYFIYIK